MPEGSRVTEAFRFAFSAHSGQYRKKSKIPYIVHPMDVASTLIKNGASEDLIVAGLLHDVVEDAGISLEEIEERFGPRVARLVKGASEPEDMRKDGSREAEKRSWPKRKAHTIEFISRSARDMKLLSCADKLANIRDMVRDRLRLGDDLWERFNATEEQQKWYYTSMVEAYGSGDENIRDKPAFLEFKDCVKGFFGP